MSLFGSSATSTTKQTSSPPDYARDLFTRSALDALKLYRSGSGFNPVPFSTVAKLSNVTRGGIDALTAAGQDPTSAYLTGAGGIFDFIGQGGGDLTTEADYRAAMARAGQPTAAESYLTSIADGTQLRDGNPYFREMLNDQAGDIANDVNMGFAAGGRYGSGANQGVVADSVGDFRREALYNQWNADADRQLQATGLIDSSRMSALDAIMAAINGITGVQSTNTAQRLAGASGMANVGQQEIDNRFRGAEAILGAGGILDDYNQRRLDDRTDKWKTRDMERWNRLGALQAAASGAAGPYGQTTATTTQEESGDPFGGILGIFGSILSALPA